MFRQCARSKENRRNISNKFKQYIYISTGTKENAIFGFGSPQRYISVPVCIVEVVWIVGSWYLCTGWIFGQLRMTVVSYDEMLDISLDGVATTLATKTKQSLLANSSGHAHGVNSSNTFTSNTVIVTMYRVAQAFSLFAKKFDEQLQRKEAMLVSTCMDLHARTYQDFLDLWEAQAQKLRQGVASVYVAALSAPSFVLEAANTLQEVLSIYQIAPVPAGEREADFLPVFILQPLTRCWITANKLPPWWTPQMGKSSWWIVFQQCRLPWKNTNLPSSDRTCILPSCRIKHSDLWKDRPKQSCPKWVYFRAPESIERQTSRCPPEWSTRAPSSIIGCNSQNFLQLLVHSWWSSITSIAWAHWRCQFATPDPWANCQADCFLLRRIT